MRDRSQLLEHTLDFTIWELGRDRLEDLTRFVFSVYYTRFDPENWADSGEDFQLMLADDEYFAANSTVFAAIGHSGRILSTARAIERRQKPLPIERDFGVSLHALTALGPVHRVFEVARLATDPQAVVAEGLSRQHIPRITDAVITRIIRTTAQENGNFWVASMDVRALALFRSRGFAFVDLGETNPAYLGSPTTPVALSIDACRAAFWQESRSRYDHYFAPSSRETAGHSSASAPPTWPAAQFPAW